jgi:hypothetical protein
MKLLSTIGHPEYDKGELVVIKLEGAIHVEHPRSHPAMQLIDGVKHGSGSHADTKRMSITAIPHHQPVDGLIKIYKDNTKTYKRLETNITRYIKL